MAWDGPILGSAEDLVGDFPSILDRMNHVPRGWLVSKAVTMQGKYGPEVMAPISAASASSEI